MIVPRCRPNEWIGRVLHVASLLPTEWISQVLHVASWLGWKSAATGLPAPLCQHRTASTALPAPHCQHRSASTALPAPRCQHRTARCLLPRLVSFVHSLICGIGLAARAGRHLFESRLDLPCACDGRICQRCVMVVPAAVIGENACQSSEKNKLRRSASFAKHHCQWVAGTNGMSWSLPSGFARDSVVKVRLTSCWVRRLEPFFGISSFRICHWGLQTQNLPSFRSIHKLMLQRWESSPRAREAQQAREGAHMHV